MKNKVLFIFGTRPEAIKLAPLIRQFSKYLDEFNFKICITAQHREMLGQVLSFFNIKPDYDLNLLKPNQNLFDITSEGLRKLEWVLDEVNPDLIFVQGDTTTALIGALAGFYKKIKVAHIEAGLRSYNKYSPFPEEINRILVDHIADYLFAPTEKAKQNLLREGVHSNIYVVGNTVIDSLFLSLDIIKNNKYVNKLIINYFKNIIPNFKEVLRSKIILVTGHRRESFGEPFRNICNALKEIAINNREINIIYPVHLNPNVRKPVFEILKGIKNIYLIEPLDYPEFIWLMEKSYLILTDSGGIQEEAPSLGKPVLVMRDVTEREEGIEAGVVKLIGTKTDRIVSEITKLINNEQEYKKMAKAINPYGDGKASDRILRIVCNEYK